MSQNTSSPSNTSPAVFPENAATQGVEVTDNGLPGINDLPDADVVIFDGQCNFCISQVKNLNRWAGNRLAFLSLHDPIVAERYPELSHDMLMKQMYVVTPDGDYFAGAAAIKYLSRKLPWLWALAPIMHIPMTLPLWQWAYDQIAKRRYRIAGRNSDCTSGSCEVHFKS